MLEAMDKVLSHAGKKSVQKGFKKKRDEKMAEKRGSGGGGEATINGGNGQADKSDTRPLVDQLFQPSPQSFSGTTSTVAIDCEMVEVDRWGEGLARVSIVNYHGHILMDKYVIPEGDQITNYRSWVSGITPQKLDPKNGAIQFKQAKEEAHEILKNKVIIGHSLKHDFQVLQLPETARPKENIRDLTSYKKYQAFNEAINQINGSKKGVVGKPCGAKSLKKLSKDFLGVTI